MSGAFEAHDDRSNKEFNVMKNHLKDKPWILCGKRFYPSDKVIFNLPSKFQCEESLIVGFPTDYLNFKPLFKSMGVRDEIGIKDYILIIKNIVKGNNDKVLSANEINNVIQILKQIVEIQKDNKDKPESLDELYERVGKRISEIERMKEELKKMEEEGKFSREQVKGLTEMINGLKDQVSDLTQQLAAERNKGFFQNVGRDIDNCQIL